MPQPSSVLSRQPKHFKVLHIKPRLTQFNQQQNDKSQRHDTIQCDEYESNDGGPHGLNCELIRGNILTGFEQTYSDSQSFDEDQEENIREDFGDLDEDIDLIVSRGIVRLES